MVHHLAISILFHQTHRWFHLLSKDLMTDLKDTARNIYSNRQFVVHIVDDGKCGENQ